MNRFGIRGRRALYALGCSLSAVGCLAPAEERAERDATIGRVQVEGLEIRVGEGLAQVREATPNAITLWASAPGFSFTVRAPSLPHRLEVTVRNCMPGAVLGVERGSARIEPGARPIATEQRYTISIESNPVEFGIQVPETEGGFAFGVMSDVQEAIDRVQDVFRAMNREPDLDFILGAGDLTERGTRSELDRFQRELRRMMLPYYTTLGNHELGDDAGNYQDYFGRANLSFVHRGVRFTLLDSAGATLDAQVYHWLDRWLELGREAPHVIAMHIPPLDPIGVRNGAFASRAEAARLLGLLARGGVDLTLYGHIHSYYSFINAGIDAHISGGGGAVPEKFDGIGRHFLVVEVSDSGKLTTRVVRVD